MWVLWVRWLDAFDAGHADIATHPRLPEDRAAHDALTEELARSESSAMSFLATATFRGNLRRCTDGRVRWRPV